MVQTRRSAASAQSSTNASGTPTTAFSLLSNENSIEPDTPLTSDGEQATKGSRISVSINLPVIKRNTRKRKAADESEDESATKVTKPAAVKRKYSRSSGYVEIPTIQSSSKAKLATPVITNGTSPPPSSIQAEDDDELDLLSEPAPQYEEQQSRIESDDSDSEFELENGRRASRSTRFTVPSIVDDSEDAMNDSEADEALLLQTAIELSHQTSRLEAQESAGVGSSSKAARPFNLVDTSRAAAAERRLRNKAKGKGKAQPISSSEYSDEDQDQEDSVILGSESELSELDLSDDEPLMNSTRKGKTKGKTTKKGKGKAIAKPKVNPLKEMTYSERMERQREARREARARKNETRQDELELMEKLGRRLTYAEKSSLALRKHHPELRDVWGDLETSVSITIPQKAEQPPGLKVTLLPFQQESLFWMRKQEKGIWSGGMLADEMGMGKTIQIISLFVSDLKKPNLVVAPTVAVMQWRNEINTHTDGMNVLVWHGHSRINDIKELQKYDVVLTTYAILESCFRKQQSGFKRKGLIVKEASPLHQIKWNRIVLDEAHNIKERATNTAKACFELESSYKWCLSGTPLQNRVGELYSLVRFLGGDPFSFYFCKKCDCKSLHWKFSDKKTCDDCGHSPMQHTCFWNNEILTPIQKHGFAREGKDAFKRLRILLDRMMLRRTKLQRADDLGLPPRTVVVRRDYFSPEEKELYTSLFSDAKRQFSTYVDSGTVLNNYSNIFSLLTRMRQMACHPDLVLRSKTNGNKFVGEAEAGEATVCRLCNDIAEDAIQAKCRHIFDRECIKQYLETVAEATPQCPVCHLALTIDLEAPALELAENVPSARQGILGRLNLNTWRSSSKIEALVEELSNLRMQDSTTKSLVFSQFVNFLDLIAYRLQKAGFQVCRLEGTMTPQARDATIQYFMNNVHVTVFLVSLKAGGVALNLTEASRVFLMDSWWNPAVEYQAMDRIHRLGQHRPVTATKLVVEDSIESRIVQLQEKKSAMVDATLSTDDAAMGRLTPEDLSFLFRL